MALPAPEETVMGMMTPKKKTRATRPVLAPIARREPPKVKGITEFVGTQKPTEAQDPESTIGVKTQKLLSVNEFVKKNYPVDKVDKPSAGWKEKNADPYAFYSKLDNEYGKATVAFYDKEYKKYATAQNKANTQNVKGTASYNSSVKTYNQAIGYLDPAANKAAAQKMLKRTGVKTVMS